MVRRVGSRRAGRVGSVRRVGVLLLALSLLIAAQRLFFPFDIQVGSRFDGEDVLPVMERCGRAAPVLLSPSTELAGAGPNFGAECTRAARTRAVEAGVLVVGGIAAFWVLFAGRLGQVEPMAASLRPLPKSGDGVSGRHRPSDDQEE